MEPGRAMILKPKERDIGSFAVRRVLPAAERRAVGPFVFFDQFGPTVFGAGDAMDVRPHPHIGLATITWLLEGAIEHRDSLGSHQVIRPGEVNWMTAGAGVVHSERSPASERGGGARLYGVQAWVALPREREETPPSFQHYPADGIPWLREAGVTAALVVGEAWGLSSPVRTLMETFYADIALDAGAALALPGAVEERAVYLLSGSAMVGGAEVAAHEMLVIPPGGDVEIRAGADSRLIAIGGAPLDGPRRIWWNFVSHDPARIEQAKADWRAGLFPKVPGDEAEFIPLPER
ncbi:MAG: pirin family protein [Alphaproteobacteria bacterium]|nr:pirin family protein [Alphaproteobacteria bacterium]